MGHTLAKAKESALPKNGSAFRRVLGVAGAGAFFVATCALTTAVTTYIGVHAIV
jgi:hypothetical protein